jgi:hypothetical protein
MGSDVVILSDDFARTGAEFMLSDDLGHGRRPSSLQRWTAWVRRAAPSFSKARAQCVLTVFSETKSRVAISRLLKPRAISVRISSSRAVMPMVCWLAALGSERFEGGGFGGDKHFSRHGFAGGFAPARDAQPEPDAEGREKDGDERDVDLDGVLDDGEAVFGVLEDGDEQTADETEDEDVALHDGVMKKYKGYFMVHTG